MQTFFKGLVTCSLICAGFITACSQALEITLDAGESSMNMQLTSTAFNQGGAIPQKYTCDGEDISPPLAWTGVPAEAKSLALIVDDPDAPSGDFVHWVLYNLPAITSELPEGVQGAGLDGKNNFNKSGYNGPCPPKGSNHHYNFKLYALDIILDLNPGVTKREVLSAMQGHVLAQGQITATYRR
jgi:Raf kinase inhibitor-like YbhB/YbcL family protein